MISSNRLIRSLEEEEAASIAPLLVPVRFARDDVLHHPGEEIRFVHFPETCIVSVAQPFATGDDIEVATVGCEGVVCLGASIGAQHVAGRWLVQIGGEAQRMARSDFVQALEKSPRFRAHVHAFLRGFLDTALLSVACNRVHDVDQRLARWLLMTADRSREGPLTLTHDTLSDMLGVHRPTVTVALRDLRADGIIETRPGAIGIIDRPRLEDRSCECYRLSVRALPPGC